MNQIEFKRRTKQLGLAVIRMTEKFPETRLAWVVKDQILRSALSVGATIGLCVEQNRIRISSIK